MILRRIHEADDVFVGFIRTKEHEVGDGSLVRDCAVYNHQGTYGITVRSGSLLSGCVAYSNLVTYGMYCGTYSTVIGCGAHNNAGTGSSSYGLYAGAGSTVTGCTTSKNGNTNAATSSKQGVGIYADGRASIQNCTATGNLGDGIRVGGSTRVTGNTCSANGNSFGSGDGAGIHTLYSGNRIEANNISANDRGIDVDLGGSLIVRNSASGNSTNYNIAAGNDVGTIQTSPVGAGAWDNFEF